MTIKKVHPKNFYILAMVVLSQLPSLFYGEKWRVGLALFYERSTRIDFAVLYYTWAINFFILACCLHYPKGVTKIMSRFILVVAAFDVVHLALFAQQIFGFSKVGISIGIVLLYGHLQKKFPLMIKVIKKYIKWPQ